MSFQRRLWACETGRGVVVDGPRPTPSTKIPVAATRPEALPVDMSSRLTPLESFDDLCHLDDFNENLLRGIYAYGFETPSRVQRYVLPVVAAGRDVVAQGQAGSGKTAAYAVGLLHRVNWRRAMCQGVIIVPTRELGLQVAAVVGTLGEYLRGERLMSTHLDGNPPTEIAVVRVVTPRCLSAVSARTMQDLRCVVVDEADACIRTSLNHLTPLLTARATVGFQLVFASTTFGDSTLRAAQRFMVKPVFIILPPKDILPPLQSYYVEVDDDDNTKLDVLASLLPGSTCTQCIVFAATWRKVEWLDTKLRGRGISTAMTHQSLSLAQRDAVLRDFRCGSSRVLLATELVAWGIDIQAVDLVVSFDVPPPPVYLHQRGRTGRYGRAGTTVDFLTSEQLDGIRELHDLYGWETSPLPSDALSSKTSTPLVEVAPSPVPPTPQLQDPYPEEGDFTEDSLSSYPPPHTTPTDQPECIKCFDDMNIPDNLLRGIYAYGFEVPSQVQKLGIPAVISGKDVILQGHSGTGKTAAYAVGLLWRINAEKKHPQALVLLPSRELAAQVHHVIQELGTYLTGPMKCALFSGGTSVSADIQALRYGVTVCVGNCGRIHDMIQRGALKAHGIKTVVLDEGDDLLTGPKMSQVYEIFRFLPQDVQTVVSSTTFASTDLQTCTKFLREPIRILLQPTELPLEGIRHYYIDTEEEYKLETLMDLYDAVTITQCITFVGSRRKVDWLQDKMSEQSFTVSSIHADMVNSERQQILHTFRAGASRLLITTDFLSRGIDIQQIQIVVNYDLPNNPVAYLHQAGRAGRYGRKGVVITMGSPKQIKYVTDVYGINLEELPANFMDSL